MLSSDSFGEKWRGFKSRNPLDYRQDSTLMEPCDLPPAGMPSHGRSRSPEQRRLDGARLRAQERIREGGGFQGLDASSALEIGEHARHWASDRESPQRSRSASPAPIVRRRDFETLEMETPIDILSETRAKLNRRETQLEEANEKLRKAQHVIHSQVTRTIKTSTRLNKKTYNINIFCTCW